MASVMELAEAKAEVPRTYSSTNSQKPAKLHTGRQPRPDHSPLSHSRLPEGLCV